MQQKAREFSARLKAVVRRHRRWSVEDRVRWFGADSLNQAVQALSARATSALKPQQKALVVGDGGELHEALGNRLKSMNISYRDVSMEALTLYTENDSRSFGIVLCAYPDARRQTRTARLVAEHPILAHLPFEHAAGLDPSRAVFRELDEYAQTNFVSPVVLDEPGPYRIYQESLNYFEQKCGLRDFLDLYQLIRAVVTNGVEGDIAEFGSFRGHSGWLIARTLQALGSDKRLYMFDTFESFPDESYGVDHFWSATHRVDYESVRAKFRDLPDVTLVKGDFTKTLVDSPVEKLALAYIDCDSYRATRYLLQELPRSYTARHALMVCEDYGHPALLGNRVAVHEVCDGLPGWFSYFSQFSGLYIMLNLGS